MKLKSRLVIWKRYRKRLQEINKDVSLAFSLADDPYRQAVAIVLRDGQASTSYLRRRLGLGYNRAATLIERMEEEGIISPANHMGKRKVLVSAEEERF